MNSHATWFRVGILLVGFWSTLASWSQETDRLNFASNKQWKAGRWYLIGQWTSSSVIKWLDGQQTRIVWDDKSCTLSHFIPRIESRGENQEDLEVLRSNSWLAIEINPVLVKETFQLTVRKPREAEYCSGEVTLPILLSGKGQGVKPVLIFQPTGSRYFGKKIDISILDLSESSDVTLDLSMGYWYLRLPNHDPVSATTPLHLLPVAQARIEWLFSDSARWGARGILEQSSASLGGKSGQKLIISNWGAGVFYQHFLRVGQGLQMRYFSEYSQFSIDDGRKIKSVAKLEAHYLSLGMLTQLYFKDKWSIGVEGKYGLPNNMAGQEATQTSYSGNFNINYRVAASMTVLTSVGAAISDTSRSQPESIYSTALGLRLDL